MTYDVVEILLVSLDGDILTACYTFETSVICPEENDLQGSVLDMLQGCTIQSSVTYQESDPGLTRIWDNLREDFQRLISIVPTS